MKPIVSDSQIPLNDFGLCMVGQANIFRGIFWPSHCRQEGLREKGEAMGTKYSGKWIQGVPAYGWMWSSWLCASRCSQFIRCISITQVELPDQNHELKVPANSPSFFLKGHGYLEKTYSRTGQIPLPSLQFSWEFQVWIVLATHWGERASCWGLSA